MKTTSRFIPSLGYQDAPKAIKWLCEVFDFEEKAVYETDDGSVAHAELTYKGHMVMVGSSGSSTPFSKLIKHPKEIGGFETQSPYIIIDEDEIDAHYQKAKKHGAKIAIDLKTEDYGGKNYSCYDPEGHLWNFGSYDPFQSANSHGEAVEELKKVEQEWNKSIESNEVDAIAGFMSDDWIIISGDGGISTKQAFLEAVKTGDLVHSSMNFETKRVQVSECCGTVTQLGTSAGTYKGEPFSYYEWSTSTFVNKSGVWQSILTMLAPARKA